MPKSNPKGQALRGGPRRPRRATTEGARGGPVASPRDAASYAVGRPPRLAAFVGRTGGARALRAPLARPSKNEVKCPQGVRPSRPPRRVRPACERLWPGGRHALSGRASARGKVAAVHFLVIAMPDRSRAVPRHNPFPMHVFDGMARHGRELGVRVGIVTNISAEGALAARWPGPSSDDARVRCKVSSDRKTDPPRDDTPQSTLAPPRPQPSAALAMRTARAFGRAACRPRRDLAPRRSVAPSARRRRPWA
jgi:hypothetical protein